MKQLFFWLVLFFYANAQYSTQVNHLTNTNCDSIPNFGTWFSQGECYQNQGQFMKATCTNTMTIYHQQCDSTCNFCENIQRIPTRCIVSGPNSFDFKCGNLPQLQPKGLVYSLFNTESCNPSTGQNFFISDAYCFNTNNIKHLSGLKFLKRDQQSIKIEWNEERRSAEFSSFKTKNCEGSPEATILFPEKKCSRIDNNYISISKP
eukprot:gene5482-9300_t